MYHGNVTMLVQIGFNDMIGDVISSQNMPKIWIDPSVFKIHGRPKAHNIGKAHGYFAGTFIFLYHFRLKRLLWLHMVVIWKNDKILNMITIWRRIWKDRPKISPKMYFHSDDVNDDATGWPENRPSTFLYKEKGTFSL